MPICATVSEAASPGQKTGFSTRAQIMAGACACGGMSTFLFLVDPSRHAVYPQCLLYKATGLYCAGCGATRAAYALLHGRVLDALHDNALFILALPLLIYLIGRFVSTAWNTNAWPHIYIGGRTIAFRGGAIFLVMVAFTVARNLPFAWFEWLRPL